MERYLCKKWVISLPATGLEFTPFAFPKMNQGLENQHEAIALKGSPFAKGLFPLFYIKGHSTDDDNTLHNPLPVTRHFHEIKDVVENRQNEDACNSS